MFDKAYVRDNLKAYAQIWHAPENPADPKASLPNLSLDQGLQLIVSLGGWAVR